MKKNIRIIVTVVVAVMLVVATFGALAGGFTAGGWSAISGSLAKSVVMGAAIGAASSAVQTAIAGGGWDDILRAGLTGAVTGAIGAAMGYGLHAAFSALGEAPGSFAADQMGLHIAHAAAEGAVGGGISEFTGGNFKDGFIGAGTSAFLTPFSSRLGLGPAGSGGIGRVAARTAVAATIGGTASALSGGKFANGAISAGFMHLFNQEVMQRQKRTFTVGSFDILGDNGRITHIGGIKDLVRYLSGAYVANPEPGWTGQCLTGAQYLCGRWENGVWYDAPQAGNSGLYRAWSLMDGDPLPGTMIAKGWSPDGGYPNRDAYGYSAAELQTNDVNYVGIFLGRTSTGDIMVFDQNSPYHSEYGVSTYPVNPTGHNDWGVVTSDRPFVPSNSYFRRTRTLPTNLPADFVRRANHQ